jgi:tRNA nucleotidyltransferase (CCA-adding enzyme)
VKRYLVGGAVRDTLLGRTPRERDWVVVGASPHDLIAAGYRQVGKDFPVFLHPETQEEHALARTERKTGPGYHGFAVHAAPDVTLEQDLARRDLTINAMARDDDGTLIDPYGGQTDLVARVMRHVSPAFAEDPLRVLRLARFMARLSSFGFTVATETRQLCRALCAAGALRELSAERVWQETARAVMESDRPSVYFDVLQDLGGLADVFAVLTGLSPHDWTLAMTALDSAAQNGAPLPARMAVLAMAAASRVDAALEGLRAPNEVRAAMQAAARWGETLRAAPNVSAATVVAVLDAVSAFRDGAQFASLVVAAQALANAQGRDDDLYGYWRTARDEAATVVARDVIGPGLQGAAVGVALGAARQARIAAWQQQRRPAGG